MSGKRILCVQEHSAICHLIAEALRNFEVVSTSSVQQAVGEVDTEKPFDLILTGQTLADGTGLELCRWLRERGMTTPILIISGGGDLTAEEISKAGAQGFVLKGAQFVADLESKIKEIFRDS